MNLPYGTPRIEDCLRRKPRSDDFFCTLPKVSREAFNQIKHDVVLPEGAIIFVEGQPSRGVFTLCQGRAKISTSSHYGKTFILRIAKPGDALGLNAVVAGKPYEVTAETMGPAHLNFVNRKDFLRFIQKHSDACLYAAQQISRDCQDAYDVVRSIGLSHSIPGRVAKFLLAWAEDGQVNNGVVHARLALTHEEIGQLMGISRETITRTLSEFRKNDIVDLKNSALVIHNKSALEHLVAV